MTPKTRGQNVVPMVGAPRRAAAPAKPGSPPPLVPYARWQTACERASGALLAGEQRLVVLGPAGTGKTLLLDQTARVLRAAGWTAVVRQADPSPLPNQPGRFVLMVDEADRLSAPDLKRLLETATGPVVLAGLDVLGARLPSFSKVTLPALNREEARDYIAQWLALTGRSPANLETAGMRRMVELSGGVPRLMSTLLGAAAWLAESSDTSVMTQLHVEEAAALRASLSPQDGEPPPPAPEPEAAAEPRSMALPTLAGVALLGLAAFAAVRLYPDETRRAAGVAGEALTTLQAQLNATLRSVSAGGPSAPPQLAMNAPPAPPEPDLPKATVPAAPDIPQLQPAPARPPPEPEPPASAQPIQAPPAEPEPQPPAQPEPQPAPQPAPGAETQAALPPPAPPQAAEDRPEPTAPEPAPTSAAPTSPAPASAAASPAPASPTAPTEAPPSPAAEPPPHNAVASASPVERIPPLPKPVVAMLVRRGREMAAIGDISAARLLFGRAADADNADAMMELGRTYDPLVIAQSNLMLTPDPDLASYWYRSAIGAGSKDAQALLDRLRANGKP